MKVCRTSFCLSLIALGTTGTEAASDLSVAVMMRPLSACNLGARESVSLQLFNHGDPLPAGARVQLSYTINGGEPVTETLALTHTLLSDSALAYSFETAADLSQPASYDIDASVRVADDVNPGNDAIRGHQVIHWAPSIGGTLHGPERADSGTLSLSGQLGRVIDWEQSTDAGGRWQVLGNATAEHEFEGLQRRTWFRVEVRHGACPPAYSSEFIVDPG